MRIALPIKGVSSKIKFWVSFIGIILMWVILDFAIVGEEILFFGYPLIAPVFIFRTIAIAFSALFLVLYAIRGRKQETLLGASLEKIPVDLGPLGTFFLPVWLLGMGSFLAAASIFGLFLTQPKQFSLLAREDKIIEVLSALLFFLSSGIFTVLSFRSLSQPAVRSRLFTLGTILFALVFFVMGMEEVSWFQRTIGFGTPEAFSGNLQEEFNLHNFATDEVEIAYYFFSFVFLVFLPFLHDQTNLFDEAPLIASFIPGRWVIFASASMVAYTYDTWNIALDQFAFFAAFFILVHYFYNSLTKNTSLAVSPVFTGAIVVGVFVFQAGFIANGDLFVRNWDITEYKELLIPLGFFIYSLEMATKESKMVTLGMVWTSIALVVIMAAMRLMQKYQL